jgi:hypothetical protein
MTLLLPDGQGLPKPQYESVDGTNFEALKGQNGAAFSYIKEGDNVTLGAKADTESSTGDGSVISMLKALRTKLTSLLAIFDGTKTIGKVDVNSLPVGTNNIGKVDINNEHGLIRNGSLVGTLSIGTAALELKIGASKLPSRRSVYVFNNSAQDVYVGLGNTVTTANGYPIKIGTERRFDLLSTETVALYAISSVASDIRIMETL